MPTISACPAEQVLQELARGKLPNDRAEQVFEHLDTCGACESTLASVEGCIVTTMKAITGCM